MTQRVPSLSSMPATRALEMLQGDLPAWEYRRTIIVSPDSSGSSLSSLGDVRRKKAFDMGDLARATEPVEDSIAFPVIEWCRDDEDESETDTPSVFKKRLSSFVQDEDEEDTSLGKRRRQCQQKNVFRSKSLKTRLSSLATSCSSGPATAALEDKLRSGSWGQFVSEEDSLCFSVGSNCSDNSRLQLSRKLIRKSPMSRSRRREQMQRFVQEPRALDFPKMQRIVL